MLAVILPTTLHSEQTVLATMLPKSNDGIDGMHHCLIYTLDYLETSEINRPDFDCSIFSFEHHRMPLLHFILCLRHHCATAVSLRN